jgi:hypothetical protein
LTRILLFETLNTPEGPAKIFYRQGDDKYIAQHRERRWIVTLQEIQLLNPSKHLDNSLSTIEHAAQAAFEERTRISQQRLSQQRYRGGWFAKQQRKVDREAAEEAAAWRRLEQRLRPRYTITRSEPFNRPQPDRGVAGPGLQPVLVLAQEIRKQEDAETRFWMRPTRDD